MRKKLQLVSECLHLYYGTFRYNLLKKLACTFLYNNTYSKLHFIVHSCSLFDFCSDHIRRENKHIISYTYCWLCMKQRKVPFRQQSIHWMMKWVEKE